MSDPAAPDYSRDPGLPTLPEPPDDGAEVKYEVEVVDDTPEPDRGRQPAAQPTEVIAGDETEDGKYGDEAKARMKRLRYVYHEERRRAEAAQRQYDEAVDFTRKLREENLVLRQQVSTSERVVIGEAKRRAEAQVENARAMLLAAHEAADNTAIVKAQEALSRAVSEHQNLENYTPKTLPADQLTVQPEPPRQEKPAPPPLDDRTRDWVKRNPWFGQPGYEEQTSIAMATHAKLSARGVLPDGESADEYWQQIDGRLSHLFPEQFGSGAGNATGQRGTQTPQQNGRAPGVRTAPSSAARPPVFAGGSKAPVNGPVKVRLTQSQAALANRLGLKPEEYARELVKQQQRES